MKITILKTIIFSVMLLYPSFLISDSASHEVVLTSEMVHFLDGKAIGINAAVVKRMLQVRREIKKLQFGDQPQRGTPQGHYSFEGRIYSIHELALLESQLEMDYYQKESEYVQNRHTYTSELVELEASYNGIKNKLKGTLAQARAEFEAKVAPFANTVRSAKDQMIVLITESCQKHNRADCFLLKWAEAPDNTEMQYFHDQITTFKALDQFCTDFTHFLDDVMRSCPKAMAQFKKLMDDQHARR